MNNSRFASNLSPRGGYNGTFTSRAVSPDRYSRPVSQFNTYQASPPRPVSPSSFALYRTRQASPNRMGMLSSRADLSRSALNMQSPRLSRASSPVSSNRNVLVASPIRMHSNPRTLIPTSSIQMNSPLRTRQASPSRTLQASPSRSRQASPSRTFQISPTRSNVEMRDLENRMSRLRISSPSRNEGSVLVGVPMR